MTHNTTPTQSKFKAKLFSYLIHQLLKHGSHWSFKWILTEDFKFWIKSNIILT